MVFREQQETHLDILRQRESQVNKVTQGVQTAPYSTKTQEEMPLTSQRDEAVGSPVGPSRFSLQGRQAQTIQTSSDETAKHSRLLGYQCPYMRG